MEKGAIFPLFYLPPLSYFSRMIENKERLIIEDSEHFQRQTYRNRAVIHSHNGKQDLIIPVLKGSKVHTRIRDVKISYDFNWQRIHWMSLQTCYRNSSYFEFYEDDLAIFYEKKWNFLFDYNEELLSLLLRLLKLTVRYNYSGQYKNDYPGQDDFRNSIHPKRFSINNVNRYFQVFEEKNGFIPDLSIVDLLFSQGPQSINYLLKR